MSQRRGRRRERLLFVREEGKRRERKGSSEKGRDRSRRRRRGDGTRDLGSTDGAGGARTNAHLVERAGLELRVRREAALERGREREVLHAFHVAVVCRAVRHEIWNKCPDLPSILSFSSFPRPRPMGEGASIYNCALCDSYALVTLGILPERKLARGPNGLARYEDLLEAFQDARCVASALLLACPTCNALARATEEDASAKPGADQVEDGDFLRDGLAVLTPCFLVSFEDGQPPPVYVDENAAKGGIKPRYRLVQGVGPAGLELDRSRTGRLHKPSLRPFGIDVRPLSLDDDAAATRETMSEACLFAEALTSCAGGDAAASVVRRAGWVRGGDPPRPALERWGEIREATEREMDEDAREYVRARRVVGGLEYEARRARGHL